MSVTVASLLELDGDRVAARRERLLQLVMETYPELRVQFGVIHNVVLHLEAALSEVSALEIDRYNRSRSLAEILADPTLADDAIVDSVLSLYKLSRLQGSAATGEIVLVLSRDEGFTLAAGSVFSAAGFDYVTTTPFTVRPTTGTASTDSERKLRRLLNGDYAFNVPVACVSNGQNGRLTKNTLLTTTEAILNFIRAYAAADFTGGQDDETNAELAARVQTSIAVQAPSNSVTLEALLRGQSSLSNLAAVSVIGYGDAEQLRDRHWAWPLSGGGRTDVYLRSTPRIHHLTLTKTARLVEKTAAGYGIWQIELSRDDAPGFYDVSQILPAASTDLLGTLEITQDTRGLDFADDRIVCDIETQLEGAYSRYQTAVIRFHDTITSTTSLTVGDTAEYLTTVRYLPNLVAAHEAVTTRASCPFGSDCLVKLPVPCVTKISFDILRGYQDTDTIDVDGICNAVANAVNALGFIGRLPSSLVVEAAHAYIKGSASLSRIDMFATILQPDGTKRYLRGTDALLVPDTPAKLVTARTAAFFLEPTDVAVSLKTVNMPIF